MGKTISRSMGAFIGVGLLLAACSGTQGGGAPIVGGSGGSGAIAVTAGSSGVGGAPCTPGSKRCDGLNVKLCDERGVTETVSQTCLPSQACSGGACVASTCVPNTKSCKDGAVWTCDANGASTLSEKCAFGLSCRVEGDGASCSPQACSPNQPVCAGDVATLCRSDGSGPSAGGVDCSNTKQACYGGKCLEVACTLGAKLCDHGSLYLCSHNGTDISLLSTCRMDEVCDGDMGSCRARLCEPGKVSCDGTRVQTCNAFGSAWLPGSVECATDGNVCVNGSCKKQVCAASRRYCQDGNAYECDSTGTVAILRQLCSQAEHCTSSGYCATNDCHAGDKVCVGNVLKVCSADNSLPSEGTACGDSQVCDSGQCKDRPCLPGAYFCKGPDVYVCDFGSTSPFFYLDHQCTADTVCKPLSTYNASCIPLPCSPGSTTCLGNKIGTCGSDGQSLSALTTDCTTTSNVCTADLKCAKSASDTLGLGDSLEQVYSGSLVGDVIDVDSARKLTELQLNLVTAAPRELRFIVYELSGQSFVPKVDKTVSNVNGSGFVSSGVASFGFNLAAGKRYLLAAVVSGGDIIDYLDIQPFTSDLSFGTAVGRVYTTYYAGNLDALNYDPSSVSHMKVITESP